MEITYSVNGNTLTFHLIGELDEHAAEYARRTMDRLLENGHYDGVVLDMSRLSFMDSTGIGVIIGRYKILKRYNCPLYVANPTVTVNKLLTLSGLYEIMQRI